jgi:hypothetical protein
MAKLFDCSADNISLHLKNIFNEGELDEKAVTEDFSATASDGKTYKTKHYNLDAVIAVGYRVNSRQATTINKLRIKVSPWGAKDCSGNPAGLAKQARGIEAESLVFGAGAPKRRASFS